MRRTLRPCLLAFLLVLSATAAWAQADSCPGATNNDQCDRIRFENADRELARAVEARLADIARRSTYTDRVEHAKALFAAAQRAWVQFRDAECDAEAAKSLVSARTVEGLTAQCLYSMTKKRMEDLHHP